jgi:hypothetical protein
MVIPAFSPLPAVLFPCSCSTASLAALKRLLRTISSHQFQALSKELPFPWPCFSRTAVSSFAILSILVFFRFLSRIRLAPSPAESCFIRLLFVCVAPRSRLLLDCFPQSSYTVHENILRHRSLHQAHFPYNFILLRFYSVYLLESFGESSLNPRIK